MSNDLYVVLKRIEEKLDSIIRALDDRSSHTEKVHLPQVKADPSPNDAITVYLLKLPDSLRQTMLAMGKLKDATTEEISQETGRSRSLESIHLNQLERMGYIQKYRRGKKIFFIVPSPPK